MKLQPENIKVINFNNKEQTMRDVITKENLTVLLIDLIVSAIEPVFGEITDIEIRNDLLRQVRKEDLILAIGGNENPASVKVINLYNKNNRICLLFCDQEQVSPKTNKLGFIDKIRKLFWHE